MTCLVGHLVFFVSQTCAFFSPVCLLGTCVPLALSWRQWGPFRGKKKTKGWVRVYFWAPFGFGVTLFFLFCCCSRRWLNEVYGKAIPVPSISRVAIARGLWPFGFSPIGWHGGHNADEKRKKTKKRQRENLSKNRVWSCWRLACAVSRTLRDGCVDNKDRQKRRPIDFKSTIFYLSCSPFLSCVPAEREDIKQKTGGGLKISSQRPHAHGNHIHSLRDNGRPIPSQDCR